MPAFAHLPACTSPRVSFGWASQLTGAGIAVARSASEQRLSRRSGGRRGSSQTAAKADLQTSESMAALCRQGAVTDQIASTLRGSHVRIELAPPQHTQDNALGRRRGRPAESAVSTYEPAKPTFYLLDAGAYACTLRAVARQRCRRLDLRQLKRAQSSMEATCVDARSSRSSCC